MMRAKILILGLICLFVFAYCKSPADPGIENALNPELPVINYFKSSTTNTGGWQMMRTLKWLVFGATKVEIDNGIGEVATEGMIEVAPAEPTIYTLTATNNVGQAQEACTTGYSDVVVVSGPATNQEGRFGGDPFIVRGEVKNTGSVQALNTKISIELYSGSSGYGPPGELLGSAEGTINAHDNGTLESQQQVSWSFTWDDTHQIMDFRMREGSEIRYEITWDE